VLELLASTLQAPVLMLWHTQFVMSALLGRSVSWKTQNRAADGTAWAYALKNHWMHLLVGIVWGSVVWRTQPAVLPWMAPVLLGMLLAVPFTVLTSRASAGERARRAGLFLTPEETNPSSDLMLLRSTLAEASSNKAQITEAIIDPYTKALHISLLQTAQADPTT